MQIQKYVMNRWQKQNTFEFILKINKTFFCFLQFIITSIITKNIIVYFLMVCLILLNAVKNTKNLKKINILINFH